MTREYIGKHNTTDLRSLKKYSQDTFRENLRATDWSSVFSSFESNETWGGFKTIFIKIIDVLAPFRKNRMNNRTKPWMNNEIIELMREREKALHQKIEIRETELTLEW